MTSHTRLCICWICGKTMPLEACKIDEHGRAVHEECCVSRLMLQSASSESSKETKPELKANRRHKESRTQRAA
jgi:hypothetical protein